MQRALTFTLLALKRIGQNLHK
ncbi:MAG TPA: hypothetical protein EYG91_04880 [Aquifex aeolicus]|nr:hypothetical protein [Aquifex aeolicus]